MSKKILLLFRGVAFGIDTMICAGIMMVIVGIFHKIPILGTMPFIIGIAFVLMFFRDVFGKSIGKYLLGLNIVDLRSKNKAKFYQRLLKNITVPFSIIEIPIVIFSKKHQRIGDLLAKTETTVDENSYALTIFNQFFQ
jgi:uncharacterized RDD family membrane protein YckC